MKTVPLERAKRRIALLSLEDRLVSCNVSTEFIVAISRANCKDIVWSNDIFLGVKS